MFGAPNLGLDHPRGESLENYLSVATGYLCSSSRRKLWQFPDPHWLVRYYIISAGFVHCCDSMDAVSLLRLNSNTPQEVSLSSGSYKLYPMHPSHFLPSPRYGVGCSCAHWGWAHHLLLFFWILTSYAFPYATKRSPSDEGWEPHSSTSLKIFLCVSVCEYVCVSMWVCVCVCECV